MDENDQTFEPRQRPPYRWRRGKGKAPPSAGVVCKKMDPDTWHEVVNSCHAGLQDHSPLVRMDTCECEARGEADTHVGIYPLMVVISKGPSGSSTLSLPGPCTTSSSSAPTVDMDWKKK
mmetsp:Transcript_18247/g.39200  ORF Transcript_18247/g.39200 Transcript_18247/m.39200 type:complete len:119 (-) Transcript_18247:918-1274(-)